MVQYRNSRGLAILRGDNGVAPSFCPKLQWYNQPTILYNSGVNQVILSVCHYQDAPHLYPLLEGYSDIFKIHDRRRVITETMKVLDEEPQHPTLYHATHESRMVGFLGFRRSLQNPQDFDLFSILIRRGYQGQGVGTKLFLYGLKDVASRGASQLSVSVNHAYPPHSKQFYKKLGFVPQFDEHLTGASNEDFRMVKDLGRQPRSVIATHLPA
jgi:ribosomal protein S18 acetylase RimI-like enzyme